MRANLYPLRTVTSLLYGVLIDSYSNKEEEDGNKKTTEVK